MCAALSVAQLDAFEDALAHDETPDLRAARHAVALDNTWDRRVAEISRLVTAALEGRAGT